MFLVCVVLGLSVVYLLWLVCDNQKHLAEAQSVLAEDEVALARYRQFYQDAKDLGLVDVITQS